MSSEWMIFARFCALIVALLTASCQAGWPTSTVPYYHAADDNSLLGRRLEWERKGVRVDENTCCNSMSPVIESGDLMAYRKFLPAEAIPPPGAIVGADGKLHLVVKVSKDGKSFYMSGVNNRYSDGWKKREQIEGVVVEIITRR